MTPSCAGRPGRKCAAPVEELVDLEAKTMPQPRTDPFRLLLGPAPTAVLVALVATLAVATARADAVPPPPDDCLEGTTGDTCHGGIFCRARGCTDGSQCDGGELCEDRELCVGQVDCAGGWDPDAGPSYTNTVEATCEGGAACAEGTCQTVKVCVPPTTASGGGTTSGGSSGGAQEVDQGCGCRLTAGPSAPSPWWILLGLPLLLSGRRRRR